MQTRATRFLFLAFLASASAAFAGNNAPDWMHEAARTVLPAYPKETAGVVLLDEQTTTVSANGEVHTLYRRAVKILSTSGRDYGTASAYYDNETKISHFKAWCIPAQGGDYEVKDKEAIESSPYEGVFADMRKRTILIPQAEPGSVVGYEYEQKSRPYMQEDQWNFQETIPVKKARYILELPAGWEYETYWLNHPKQDPAIAGSRYTWEVTDVAAIKPEPRMPSRRAISGRMGISFFSGAGAHGSWTNVGKWSYELNAPRRVASPAMQDKVKQLTAGKTTALAKIRALGTFVQRDVRYVDIEIGIGGFQAHTAPDVFINRYGDCKDKATLLGAMLHEAGINSYPMLAQTHRGVVDATFPSAFSFNHMILAISVPESEDLASEKLYSVVKHPKLGRLMIFDPTWSEPLGYLPEYTQGNQGLLLSEAGGELLPYPMQAPESNQILRTANLKLSADGLLSGEVIEHRTGNNAVEYREELMALQVPERVKRVERFLDAYLTGFSVKEYKVDNLEDFDKELVVHYTFEASNYAKQMGDLLLVRPRVFGSRADSVLDWKERKYAFEVGAPSMQEDEFNITLPPGFVLDELPRPAKVSALGTTYSSEVKMNGNILAYKRKYQSETVEVPLDKITEWNATNSVITRDERNAAVFKKAQ